MRGRRALFSGGMAGFLGIVSLWVLAVQPAQAWRFLPKEGVFIYPRIDGVGYLTPETPQGMGRVVTTRAEKAIHIGEGEIVYVDVGTRHGIKVGDRLIAFSLFKPRELKDLRMVVIEARLRITEVKEEEAAALVEDSFRSITLGSRVDRYVPTKQEMPLKPAPSVTGRILWSDENLISFGEGDVVFLNKGAADGVEPGQCFQLYRTPMAEADTSPRKPGAPAKDHLTTGVGEVVVLKTQPHTSAALVRKSLFPLEVGERFRAGCAWEEAAKKAPPPPGPARPAAAPDDAFRKAKEEFENRDVLYAYDSYVLSEAARDILQSKAKFLKAHPDIQVLVEGHCDERGTREYNLALGDRRANASKMYLVALGIPAERMKTVSYGKERPLDPGHHEQAWSKNRRAHFVIQNR